MDAGVFCVAGVGAHFFFLAVFAVNAVNAVKACGRVSMLFYNKRFTLAWTVPAYTPAYTRRKDVGPGIQMGL